MHACVCTHPTPHPPVHKHTHTIYVCLYMCIYTYRCMYYICNIYITHIHTHTHAHIIERALWGMHFVFAHVNQNYEFFKNLFYSKLVLFLLFHWDSQYTASHFCPVLSYKAPTPGTPASSCCSSCRTVRVKGRGELPSHDTAVHSQIHSTWD